MDIKSAKSFLVVFVSSALLASCNSGPQKPAHPVFVSAGERQKARIEPVSQGFGDMVDTINAGSQRAFVDTEVNFVDSVLNEGAPASGIKVVLKGSAFDDGIISAPVRVFASASQPDGTGVAGEAEIDMAADAAGDYVGTARLPVTSSVNVGVTATAKKGGDCEAKLLIYPLDKGGTSQAGFSHTFQVLSENAEAE